MAWSLKNYQRGGVVDPWGIARPSIIALAKYVATKAGVPDVRMQFTPGNYAHKQGLAVDIQPGGGAGNPEAMRALRAVVEGLDWGYWGIRYAAGMRHEYGGSWGGVERKRPQTKPYVGSDGWHDRHWHIDVHPDAHTRDWQNLLRGTSAPATPAAPSKAVAALLTTLDYADVRTAQRDLGLVVDGYAGPLTTEALEAEMSKLDALATEVDKIKQALGTEVVEGREFRTTVLDILADVPGAIETLEAARKRAEQNNKVLSVLDPRNPANKGA